MASAPFAQDMKNDDGHACVGGFAGAMRRIDDAVSRFARHVMEEVSG
jgi:hypothetical protein